MSSQDSAIAGVGVFILIMATLVALVIYYHPQPTDEPQTQDGVCQRDYGLGYVGNGGGIANAECIGPDGDIKGFRGYNR